MSGRHCGGTHRRAAREIERRRGLRVPIRGRAVLYGERGPLHGTVANLSHSGALLEVADQPFERVVDVELRLAEGAAWVNARAVRVEPIAKRWRIAVAFDRVDPPLERAIRGAIDGALLAAQRRPVLVIDDRAERRDALIARLADRGMTPLAPRTPLEALDVLARAQLHVDVCLLAAGFGVPTTDLEAVLTDSFPWVATREITDDVEQSARRAVEAWHASPMALLAG